MITLIARLRVAVAALALTLASLVLAPYVQAQQPLARVNIPFDFEYGTTHMRAGNYRLTMPNDSLLVLSGRAQSALVLVEWSENGQPARAGKLVFRRYGDLYLLKEVWMPGEIEHVQLPRSKSDKVLEEISQTAHQAPSTTEVALSYTQR